MNTAIDLLKECGNAQVKLEVVGPNKLNYVCPRGALSEDLKQKLVRFKPVIIEHLSSVNNMLASVCKEYSITRDWLNQVVICPQDIEDFRTGDLTVTCLKAHIEYHLEEQRKWQKLREEINGGYGSSENVGAITTASTTDAGRFASTAMEKENYGKDLVDPGHAIPPTMKNLSEG